MKARRGWALVCSAALLCGCSPSTQLEQDTSGPLKGLDLSTASSAQAEEIEDRNATADEYRAGFQRYRDCLSSKGFELESVELSNSVYEYGLPDAAVSDGADTQCYDAEFRFVDMLWQTSEEMQEQVAAS